MKRLLIILFCIFCFITIAHAASDDFTDDNGTALATHDANWTSVDATYTVADAEINGNLCEAVGGFDRPTGYWNGSVVDLSQIVIVGGANIVTDRRHASVRMDTNERGYAMSFGSGDGSEWDQINITKSGGFHSSFVGVGPWDYASNHTFKITASGVSPVTIEAFVDGGSLGTKADAAAELGVGHPGFWTTQTVTDIEDSRYDNWTDGVIDGVSIPVVIHHRRR